MLRFLAGPLLRRVVPPSAAASPVASFLRRLPSPSALFHHRAGAPSASASLCLPRQLRGPLVPSLPACGGGGGGAIIAASPPGAARGISTRRRRVRKMNKHRFQKRKKRMRNLNAKNLRTK